MPIVRNTAAAEKVAPAESELSKLFPAVTYTTMTGDVVTIRPVTFGQLKAFLDSVGKLIAKVNAAGIDDITNQSNWGHLFALASDEIGSITAMILDKDQAWIDKCDVMTDLLSIWTIIIQQNINDFTKKKFQTLVNSLKSAIPTSSNSSFIVGGAGVTSSS